MVPENHVRLHPVSQGLSCRSPGWWHGILWPDGRYYGCQSLSALLGGALYLRYFRFRYRLFSGCNLRCVFCQNHNIALGKAGRVITPEHLVKIFLQLQEQGANNINLVTPTHFLPQIVIALEQAKQQGLHLPIVYNTSSYESPEALHHLEGLVDIYLPDLKYFSPELSTAYSHAPDYFETACAAISEMYRQVGDPVIDEDTGLMQHGMIVRHLLLPGQTKDSKKSCAISMRLTEIISILAL